jgi:hypothetical protein
MAKRCPTLAFTESTSNDSYEAQAHTRAGALVGKIKANREGARHLGVSWVSVSPNYMRCGIGTRLYTVAAHAACKEGLRLASDDLRSPFSQAFWEKQVAKGRARCVRKGDEGAPRGTLQIVRNRGGCQYYALTAPCPIGSLAGGRRRKR